MTHSTIPTLTTQRLILRGPKDSDVAPLAAFLISPRAKWIGGPHPDADAAEWLGWQRGRWAKLGRGSWIVALPDDDTPIGRMGLLEHEGWPEPEPGWFLFEGFDGHGYAHEAALAARAHAAEVLNLPPLFSFIEPANQRSKALALRLGAMPEKDVRLKGTALTVYRHPGPETVHRTPHERPIPGPAADFAADFAALLAARRPVIETVRLRTLRPDDLDVRAKILCGPAGAHLGGPFGRDEAFVVFAASCSTRLLRGHGVRTVEPKAGGKVLGFILIGLEPGDHQPEPGCLFRSAAEGQGYATEAAKAARDHAFATLGPDRLVSYVDPANAASGRLANRLGELREAEPDGSEVRVHRAVARAGVSAREETEGRQKEDAGKTSGRRRKRGIDGHRNQGCRAVERPPRRHRPAGRNSGLHTGRTLQANPGRRTVEGRAWPATVRSRPRGAPDGAASRTGDRGRS